MRSFHVVIVNYNSADLVASCLESFGSRAAPDFLLVDSASPRPGEVTRLRELEGDGVEVIALERNLGFGAAVNSGVSSLVLHDDDIVWILNPDTRVEDGAVEEIWRALDAAPNAIVSPVIVQMRAPHDVWFAGGYVDTRSYRVRHSLTTGGHSAHRPFVPGTALAMRVETWRAIGGFREDLFMYWEDADLCLRAGDLGYPVEVIESARVRHLEGGSSTSDGVLTSGRSRIYYQYVARNRLKVMGDREGRRALFGARAILVSAALVLTPLRRERDERLAKMWSVARGTWDGFMWRRSTRPESMSN